MSNNKKNGSKKAEATFKMFQPSGRTYTQVQEDVPDASTSFQFINVEGAKPKILPSARRAARVHVMRKFHSDKRKKDKAPPQVPKEGIAARDLALPLRSSPRFATRQQVENTLDLSQEAPMNAPDASHSGVLVPNIWDEWCAGCRKLRWPNHEGVVANASHLGQCTCSGPKIPTGLEPAPPSTFSVDPSLARLLHFTINGVARSTVPMGLQSETAWFAQAMTDQAFFHGTLLIGLTFVALVRRPFSLPPECFYHYNEAIKHTSANLEDEKNQIREGTVAAVTCLAAFETAVNSNVNGESIHLQGLEKVMNLRKSRQQLSLSEYLQKFISWVDTCHSVANVTRPRFLSIKMQRTIPANPTLEQESHVKTCLESEWGAEFPSAGVKAYEGMDAATAKLFHRVRQLSALATRYCAMGLDPVHQRQYTEGLLLIERQIVASVWSMASNNLRQSSEERAIKACARTWHSTVLTYIHVFLRHEPRNSWKVIVDKLASRSRYSLKILTPTELWDDFPPKFLLWVLLIQGYAAEGHPQRTWLAEVLSQLRGRLELQSWDDALIIVKEYAWVDEFCTKPCEKFFEESTVVTEIIETESQE